MAKSKSAWWKCERALPSKSTQHNMLSHVTHLNVLYRRFILNLCDLLRAPSTAIFCQFLPPSLSLSVTTKSECVWMLNFNTNCHTLRVHISHSSSYCYLFAIRAYFCWWFLFFYGNHDNTIFYSSLLLFKHIYRYFCLSNWVREKRKSAEIVKNRIYRESGLSVNMFVYATRKPILFLRFPKIFNSWWHKSTLQTKILLWWW